MAQPETSVYIRFRVQPHTVDPDTTARFIQEFVMDKFSFIEACEPMRSDGFGKIIPVGDKCIDRTDRPVKFLQRPVMPGPRRQPFPGPTPEPKPFEPWEEPGQGGEES